MHDRNTTVRSRELGDLLRQALVEAGLSNREAGRRLGWSDSKISRLLTGKRGGKAVDVASLLALCGITGEQRERMLRLCADVDTPGCLQQHGTRLPKQLRTLIDHEDKAVRIADFQPIVVPGLLQTSDYAYALLKGIRTLPPDEIDDRVAARFARQSLFGRSRQTSFEFFVHEFALRLPVGSNEVMSDQLHHMLRMSVRPYLNLRVVPVAAGVHAGIAGAFKLMEFSEIKPVVYLDSETASVFLEEAEEIVAYRTVLHVLADIALDERQSKDLIADLATELYPHVEDEA